MKAFDKLRSTTDPNGIKSLSLSQLTTDLSSQIYPILNKFPRLLCTYAHPYTSCDKGSVERHNGLIRRYIPKGDRMDKYSVEDIAKIEVWCNSLHRKILNYKIPEEYFDTELDRIYRRR